MLVKFKLNGNFVYINPDQVFLVRKWDDESTAIWPGGNVDNYTVVDEPLDRVAMRLNDALRR